MHISHKLTQSWTDIKIHIQRIHGPLRDAFTNNQKDMLRFSNASTLRYAFKGMQWIIQGLPITARHKMIHILYEFLIRFHLRRRQRRFANQFESL